MNINFSFFFLFFIGFNSFSQVKKLPAGWDLVLLDDKIAYMNLITGTVSKTYPKKASVKPLKKLAFDPTITHKVKKGETLSIISRKYDLKLARLYRLNSMTNFDTLKIGQEIVIGYGQSEAEKIAFFKKHKYTPKPKNKTALNAEYAKRFALIVEKEPITKPVVKKVKKTINYHIVMATETLYGIASKYKISVNKLKEQNNIKNNTISIGQKLRVN